MNVWLSFSLVSAEVDTDVTCLVDLQNSPSDPYTYWVRAEDLGIRDLVPHRIRIQTSSSVITWVLEDTTSSVATYRRVGDGRLIFEIRF